jgi:hypothetical protein
MGGFADTDPVLLDASASPLCFWLASLSCPISLRGLSPAQTLCSVPV